MTKPRKKIKVETLHLTEEQLSRGRDMAEVEFQELKHKFDGAKSKFYYITIIYSIGRVKNEWEFLVKATSKEIAQKKAKLRFMRLNNRKEYKIEYLVREWHGELVL